MKTKILNAYKNKMLVGLYTNYRNPNLFSVGYIVYVDEKSYILYEISPYGKFNGYSCELIENIVKIEKNSKYLNNIEKLINYYNFKIDTIIIDEKKPLIFEFLEIIKSSNRICSILTYNSEIFDIVGFIKTFDEKVIEILQIDENANDDGLIMVDLDNVDKIVCCSDDEIKLENLYKINNK